MYIIRDQYGSVIPRFNCYSYRLACHYADALRKRMGFDVFVVDTQGTGRASSEVYEEDADLRIFAEIQADLCYSSYKSEIVDINEFMASHAKEFSNE
jgi:uncharacterized protein (UPF0254 family)